MLYFKFIMTVGFFHQFYEVESQNDSKLFHQALLMAYDVEGPGNNTCLGALVGAKWILGFSKCVEKLFMNFKDIKGHAGFMTKGEERFQQKRNAVNYLINDKNMLSESALVKVDPPFQLASNVKIANLPKKGQQICRKPTAVAMYTQKTKSRQKRVIFLPWAIGGAFVGSMVGAATAVVIIVVVLFVIYVRAKKRQKMKERRRQIAIRKWLERWRRNNIFQFCLKCEDSPECNKVCRPCIKNPYLLICGKCLSRPHPACGYCNPKPIPPHCDPCSQNPYDYKCRSCLRILFPNCCGPCESVPELLQLPGCRRDLKYIGTADKEEIVKHGQVALCEEDSGWPFYCGNTIWGFQSKCNQTNTRASTNDLSFIALQDDLDFIANIVGQVGVRIENGNFTTGIMQKNSGNLMNGSLVLILLALVFSRLFKSFQ